MMKRALVAAMGVLLLTAPAWGQLRRAAGAAGQGNIHEPFTGPVTADKIRAAIDDAVMFLRSRQANDGSIPSGHAQGGGTALAALTMLAAGADPASDDGLKKALNYLAGIKPDNTYVRGIRANVWEYALRKVPYDEKIRAMLKEDFDWLLKARNKEGWRYTSQSTDWDNSCTQYGVLGLWACARAGLEVPEEVWEAMSAHFRKVQSADGGWSYTTGGSTANMATAGLASLFLVFDMHHGKSFFSRENPRAFTEGDAAKVLESLDRGMTWLGKAGGKGGGYYLYGIERTGVAGGRKYFGGEDWFAGGARTILREQAPSGAIPGGYGDVVNTSFSTLFLVYGGAPVAFNKLEHGSGQDWNLNPRDLANLTKHLWGAYERPLNWQSVSIDAPATELEAPILVITGSAAAKFSEEQMLKLREYILRGGTVLAEPSDHSEEFAGYMQDLLKQMFPPGPGDFSVTALKDLPADHGIYTVLKQDWKDRPRLRGAGDRSRTFFLLSDGYMSADWQMNRTDSDAFKLGMNLLFYATDMGELEGKFASILPDTPAAKERKKTLTVARVKRPMGSMYGPGDWNAAAMSWRVFAPYAKHVTGCELVEARPVIPGRDKLEGIDLLHLTGRYGHTAFTNPEGTAALKAFVEGGGTLLVDAYAGTPEFARMARRVLERTFGKLAPLPDDYVLADGRFEGGEDLAGVRFTLPARRALRARGEKPTGQKLLVWMIGSRPAVILSEFDLSAAMAGIPNYQSLGYKPASARRIVGNILAYMSVD